MSGRLVSEKRTARQVQPPSAKDGCASLMQAYECATPDRARPFNPYRGGGALPLPGRPVLDEAPALAPLHSLGCRVRVPARLPLLRLFLMRTRGEGRGAHVRESPPHPPHPCRASHTASFREQKTAVS